MSISSRLAGGEARFPALEVAVVVADVDVVEVGECTAVMEADASRPGARGWHSPAGGLVDGPADGSNDCHHPTVTRDARNLVRPLAPVRPRAHLLTDRKTSPSRLVIPREDCKGALMTFHDGGPRDRNRGLS